MLEGVVGEVKGEVNIKVQNLYLTAQNSGSLSNRIGR
jgi:hypothetical protein